VGASISSIVLALTSTDLSITLTIVRELFIATLVFGSSFSIISGEVVVMNSWLFPCCRRRDNPRHQQKVSKLPGAGHRLYRKAEATAGEEGSGQGL